MRGLKAARPKARIIVFVRGGGPNLRQLVEAGFADCVALDWTPDPAAVLPSLPKTLATQGKSDPSPSSPAARRWSAASTRSSGVRGRPHVFNLGHGIVPETPIAHVERMLAKGAERSMSRAATAPPIAVSEEVVDDLALVLVRHFLLALWPT